MAAFTLVIGNKNFSSWSLRPWLALKQTGAAFEEVLVPLRKADSRDRILAYSKSGKVPFLRHGSVDVWESLAICEYLAELFPAAGLWPADSAARAMARAVATEMHAGFVALRQNMSMDIKASKPGEGRTPEVAQDIARIAEIWHACRAAYGKGGPFLFGSFGIADAMYAPVVTRFATYGVELDSVCREYCAAVQAHPPMREWCDAARAEKLTLD
jgi:glutathione S-transferase